MKYNFVAVVGRLQAGPHEAHEAMLKYAASRIKKGGTLVVFLGSAQCWRSTSNPFYWVERLKVLETMLSRIVGYDINFQIIPQRDFGHNLVWANHLLSKLRALASNPGDTFAICDASKNGADSNYSEWFGSSLSFIPFELKQGISATPYRREFFRTGEISLKNRALLCRETYDFLMDWKENNPADFLWLKQELLFLENYNKPLPKLDRQVIVAGESVLLYQRLKRPGKNQFDIPLAGESLTLNEHGKKIEFPSAFNLIRNSSLLPDQPISEGEFKGQRVQLWDLDKARSPRVHECWSAYYSMPFFEGRLSGLARISDNNLPELIEPSASIKPVWVPLASLPTTPLFRREALLNLQVVLGFIPVQHPGAPYAV